MADVTEFVELDPNSFHLVPEGATDFPVLLAKGVDDAISAELGLVHPCFEDDCGVCGAAGAKAKLHAAERKKLPDSAFALPEKREYPIHDENHARAALSMLHNASPEDQKRIKAAVHRRYPNIGKDDDDVKDTKKADASPDASLSQTRSGVSSPEPAGCSPDPEDGGTPRSVSFPHGDVSDGEGDTAPDKNVPRGEALSQTAGAQTNKATVDGGGDTAPDKDEHRSEAESQTSATPANNSGGSSEASAVYAAATAQDQNSASVKADADTPDSPGWEQHDAALADSASQLISQAKTLVDQLGSRERAEMSKETEGAIRQQIEDLQKALADTHPSTVSKEEIEMTNDELQKVLDERDERLTARLVEAISAAKAPEAEEEAAKADAEPAEDAEASKAAEAPSEVEELRKQLAETQDLVAKMAAEDGKHVAVNAAGATAMLRGTPEQRDSVFKQLEDRVAGAQERGDYEAVRTAKRQLTAAKLVAQENARVRGEIPRSSRFGPDSAELFDNTGSLPEDTDLHGV